MGQPLAGVGVDREQRGTQVHAAAELVAVHRPGPLGADDRDAAVAQVEVADPAGVALRAGEGDLQRAADAERRAQLVGGDRARPGAQRVVPGVLPARVVDRLVVRQDAAEHERGGLAVPGVGRGVEGVGHLPVHRHRPRRGVVGRPGRVHRRAPAGAELAPGPLTLLLPPRVGLVDGGGVQVAAAGRPGALVAQPPDHGVGAGGDGLGLERLLRPRRRHLRKAVEVAVERRDLHGHEHGRGRVVHAVELQEPPAVAVARADDPAVAVVGRQPRAQQRVAVAAAPDLAVAVADDVAHVAALDREPHRPGDIGGQAQAGVGALPVAAQLEGDGALDAADPAGGRVGVQAHAHRAGHPDGPDLGARVVGLHDGLGVAAQQGGTARAVLAHAGPVARAPAGDAEVTGVRRRRDDLLAAGRQAGGRRLRRGGDRGQGGERQQREDDRHQDQALHVGSTPP